MNQICKQCGKEVVSVGKKPRKYCSDACRMSYKRTKETNKVGNEQDTLTIPKPSTCGITTERVGLDKAVLPDADKKKVVLSDGQEMYVDPSDSQKIVDWHNGKGTAYQQQLGTLSLQYDYLRGSARAKARAAELLFPMGIA